MRGICVLLMILDHLAMLIALEFAPHWYASVASWDAFSLFCRDWITGTARPVIHEVVLVFFFSISGISCTLSRSNRQRGSILLIIAMIYSLCTLLAEKLLGMYGISVTFGVLNFLAVSMLIYALISWICKNDCYHIAIWATGICGITLILHFCYTPPATTPKFFGIVFPPYDAYGHRALFYRPSDLHSSGDLFTLIPYLAYYFTGVVLAPFLYPNRRSLLPKLAGKWNKPVNFIGRHALIIYVLHIVVFTLLLALITFAFITPGQFPL